MFLDSASSASMTQYAPNHREIPAMAALGLTLSRNKRNVFANFFAFLYVVP